MPAAPTAAEGAQAMETEASNETVMAKLQAKWEELSAVCELSVCEYRCVCV